MPCIIFDIAFQRGFSLRVFLSVNNYFLSAVSQCGALPFFIVLTGIPVLSVDVTLIAFQRKGNGVDGLAPVVDAAVPVLRNPELQL